MSLKLNNDTANGSVTLQASNTATGDVVATLPPFSTELAPRMQLMTAKTASGTSVDFTGIPSWAKKITVMYDGVSTNGSSAIQIQLGTSSGVVTNGYTSSSTQFATTAMSSANYTTGFAYKISGNTVTYCGNTNVLKLTGNTYSVNGNVGNYLGDYGCIVGGSVTISGVLDRIRITTVNGTDTFDAGAINILVEG